MPISETDKKRAATSIAMKAKKGHIENYRSVGARTGTDPHWQYMLSYLNRAQRHQWDQYSPIQQRKIMEEIEKKLERKMPEEEHHEYASSRESSFDVDAYLDEEKPSGEYRIRGHPGEEMLRKMPETKLRRNQSILRVNAGRGNARTPERKGILEEGSSNAPGNSAAMINRRQMVSGAHRSAAGDNGSWKAPSKGKKLSARAAAAIKGERLQVKKGPLLTSENGVRLQADLSVPGRGKKIGMQSYLREEKKGQRKTSPEAGSVTRKDTVRENAAKAEIRGQGNAYRQVGERNAVNPAGAGLKQKEQSLIIRKTNDEIRTKEDDLRKDAAKVKTVRLKAESGGDTKIEPLKERTKDSAKKADVDGTLKKLPPEGKSVTKEITVLKPNEKRSVTLVKKDEEKEVFKPYAIQGKTGRPPRKSRRAREKETRRRIRYEKEFSTLLIATIEKDMAKQSNISQAQKSGQISATVSELTGETGRSTLRTSTIPLRVSLQILTKRLRQEIKKRMKEAARNLVQYAVTFAGPVFAVVIIVLLLASICLIGTTTNEPSGSGLGYLIVQEAKKHIGLPYVYGGTSLEEGCDCSGFVWAIYNLFGYNLPRTAGDQYSYGRKVGSDINDWQMGDLIYYSKTGTVQSGGGRAEHIVIYIGGGQVISCGPVAIYNWDYRSDYYGTCRIIPDEASGGDFSGSTNEEICWNYFISQGFSEAATAGILGNMYVESAGTFDPSIHQYGGGPGRGLCQWEESYSGGSGRYNNLVAFANSLGKSWDDITAQLQFVSYELSSGQMNPYFSKFGGVEAFKNSSDPVDATYVFLCGFEYCGDPGASYMESNFSLSTRTSHASWAYQNYQ